MSKLIAATVVARHVLGNGFHMTEFVRDPTTYTMTATVWYPTSSPRYRLCANVTVSEWAMMQDDAAARIEELVRRAMYEIAEEPEPDDV